jgi:hypothetical protein
LNRLGINRFPSTKIDSLDTIETYVADGFGVGLGVSIPKTKMSLKILSFVLKGFAPVVPGALWRGKHSPPLRTLLDELQVTAHRLRHSSRSAGSLGREMAKELLLGTRK